MCAILNRRICAIFTRCLHFTAPGRPAPIVEPSTAALASLQAPTPQVRATSSSVSVWVLLVLPTPCYSVNATDRIDGHELIIKLKAKSKNIPCVQSTSIRQYMVTSGDVPVSVTHLIVEQSSLVSADNVIADRSISRGGAEVGG